MDKSIDRKRLLGAYHEIAASYFHHMKGLEKPDRIDLWERVLLDLEEARKRGRLTELRAWAKEAINAVGEYSAIRRAAFTARLSPDAAEVAREMDSKTRRRVQKVLLRGRIVSEHDYYAIRDEIDHLEGQPERAGELEALYALVERFEGEKSG